ncbi:VOC family protein [Mycobacterium colombiense]|uniref:VOC family protein n=1 Tax=Mycobacterium colombiense TaxID=339268 RepID=UPI00200B44B8|nr:VOC family protein [Mycobacterium colombiense]MCK8647106.1 VOC family protein [Mycobacterium colombiense]
MRSVPERLSPQLNHIGLYVYQLREMERFYTDVLGLVVADRGVGSQGRLTFLTANPESHHQLLLVEGRDPKSPRSNVSQLSFLVDNLDYLRRAHGRLHDAGVNVRPVNHGVSWSLYFPDPEGNNVELFTNSPWYIDQPHAEPFDPQLPTEDLMATTLAMCKQDPKFSPIEEYRERVRVQLAAKLTSTPNSFG